MDSGTSLCLLMIIQDMATFISFTKNQTLEMHSRYIRQRSKINSRKGLRVLDEIIAASSTEGMTYLAKNVDMHKNAIFECALLHIKQIYTQLFKI